MKLKNTFKILLAFILVLSINFSIETPVLANGETPCFTESENVICDDGNTYNGYFWFGYWVDGLPTQATQLTERPPLVIGRAVFYAPWLMEATAEFRDLNLDGYLGGVSVISCGEIGNSVWLKRPGYSWEGPYLVADCSRRNDMEGQVRYGNLNVEVDFDTAVRWNMAIYGGEGNDGSENAGRWTAINGGVIDNVLVSKYPPAYITDIHSAVPVLKWFENIVEYAKPKDDLYRLLSRPPRTWRVEGVWITIPEVVYPEIRFSVEMK